MEVGGQMSILYRTLFPGKNKDKSQAKITQSDPTELSNFYDIYRHESWFTEVSAEQAKSLAEKRKDELTKAIIDQNIKATEKRRRRIFKAINIASYEGRFSIRENLLKSIADNKYGLFMDESDIEYFKSFGFVITGDDAESACAEGYPITKQIKCKTIEISWRENHRDQQEDVR